MNICCQAAVSLQCGCLCFGAVSVMTADTSCFSCDPVIVRQTPSVVYSEMSSVFTFTSCLFPTLLYVLYILYSFTILQHSAMRGHWQGHFRGQLLVRIWALIGHVTIHFPKPVPSRHLSSRHLPRRASSKKNGVYSTAAEVARQQTVGRTKEGKCKKKKKKREEFLNRNLRMGILLKVLNRLNIKYKPMQC